MAQQKQRKEVEKSVYTEHQIPQNVCIAKKYDEVVYQYYLRHLNVAACEKRVIFLNPNYWTFKQFLSNLPPLSKLNSDTFESKENIIKYFGEKNISEEDASTMASIYIYFLYKSNLMENY